MLNIIRSQISEPSKHSIYPHVQCELLISSYGSFNRKQNRHNYLIIRKFKYLHIQENSIIIIKKKIQGVYYKRK